MLFGAGHFPRVVRADHFPLLLILCRISWKFWLSVFCVVLDAKSYKAMSQNNTLFEWWHQCLSAKARDWSLICLNDHCTVQWLFVTVWIAGISKNIGLKQTTAGQKAMEIPMMRAHTAGLGLIWPLAKLESSEILEIRFFPPIYFYWWVWEKEVAKIMEFPLTALIYTLCCTSNL